MKRVLVFLTAAGLLCGGASGALEFTADDARTAFDAASEFVREHTPRDAGTLRARLAAQWILDRVSRTGVDAELDRFRAPTPDGERPFANVVVELPGTKTNAPWLVVMSHFDTAPRIGKGFQGANDGASTTGLLIALAGVIRRAGPLPDNVAFVWTDGEECRIAYGEHDGFQGSRRLMETYRDRRRAVKAAVCLDMLGDRDLHITVPANSSPVLKKLAAAAAARAKRPNVLSLADGLVVKDDHSAFFDAGCPAIDFIDFDFGSAPGKNDYWHTPHDTIDKISTDSLLASGQIVTEFLNLLSGF